MTTDIPTRDEVPKELTWDLEAIFSSDELWEEEFTALQKEIPEISKFQGKLSESVDQLFNLLNYQDIISCRLWKLYVYAHMRNDEDTTNATYKSMNHK